MVEARPGRGGLTRTAHRARPGCLWSDWWPRGTRTPRPARWRPAPSAALRRRVPRLDGLAQDAGTSRTARARASASSRVAEGEPTGTATSGVRIVSQAAVWMSFASATSPCSCTSTASPSARPCQLRSRSRTRTARSSDRSSASAGGGVQVRNVRVQVPMHGVAMHRWVAQLCERCRDLPEAHTVTPQALELVRCWTRKRTDGAGTRHTWSFGPVVASPRFQPARAARTPRRTGSSSEYVARPSEVS